MSMKSTASRIAFYTRKANEYGKRRQRSAVRYARLLLYKAAVTRQIYVERGAIHVAES